MWCGCSGYSQSVDVGEVRAQEARRPALTRPVPACPCAAVLAIGGVGGLAVGLAGREILENLFTGLIILSSNPFEVRRSLVCLI